MSEPGLKRSITTLPAILLVVSAIIGSGVFKKIAPMSESLQSPQLVLLCWGAAGLISLTGALCNAELAAMMPGSGGEFIYFKKIYGRFFSYLYSWANLAVMRSSTIAALSFIFAESLSVLLPFPDLGVFGGASLSVKIVASLLVLALCYVNHRGVVFGEKLSRVFVTGIILAIVAIVVAAFSSSHVAAPQFIQSSASPEGWQLFTAFFVASLSAFWGYEGWNNIGYIGEEIKNPSRNLPIALGAGTILVIILYMSVNAAYLHVLPVNDLAALAQAKDKIAAVEVARVIGGQAGAIVLSVLILMTTFNCTNSTILTSTRVFFAMSRDGLFLKHAARVHPVHNTPSAAIFLQGGWAIILLWLGNFDQLTDMLIFAAFIFYGATALGVILLRKKDPHMPRPFKVIGYPVLPAVFALFCLALVLVTLFQRPNESLMGLLLIALGIPIYFLNIKKLR